MFDLSEDALLRFLITYPIFLLSLTIHELAHAITAKWGGDLTSAYQGRVTLNPFSHIDPIGTVLMPVLMAFSPGLPLIGWAKPVPVVETNFKRGSNYGMIVAMAGPFSNFLQAIFFVILAQVLHLTVNIAGFGGFPGYGWKIAADPNFVKVFELLMTICAYAIEINLVLMLFNLIPIPPLDGSHLLWHLYVKQRPQLHDAFVATGSFGFVILIALGRFGVTGLYIDLFSDPLMKIVNAVINLPTQFMSY